MSFNTSNLKFYPFVHRDNSQYTSLSMPEIDGQFSGFEISGIAGPLFSVISKSELLAEETKRYLTKILSSGVINEYSIDSIAKTHDSYCFQAHSKGVLTLTLEINRY